MFITGYLARLLLRTAVCAVSAPKLSFRIHKNLQTMTDHLFSMSRRLWRLAGIESHSLS